MSGAGRMGCEWKTLSPRWCGLWCGAGGKAGRGAGEGAEGRCFVSFYDLLQIVELDGDVL